MPIPQGKNTTVCMGQYSNKFTQSVNQIAYFESPKRKIFLEWEGNTPSPLHQWFHSLTSHLHC